MKMLPKKSKNCLAPAGKDMICFFFCLFFVFPRGNGSWVMSEQMSESVSE